MRIHLIACGGAVMHNMTIALHLQGHQITGSDDAIYEPALSRLAQHGLLPHQMGWDPNRITNDLDAVILGMHARIDNPELIKAQELGLTIYSFPEFIYENSKNKKRIVIGGSHGKTSTTAMIMHVLNFHHLPFDYMVGSQVQGFDTMVKLTHESPVIILEGDEYLSSPIDPRPKFHLYHPHIALLTGIAWDHINVFPTFENYVEQFRLFVETMKSNSTLFYFGQDEHLRDIADYNPHVICKPYDTPKHHINEDHHTVVSDGNREYPLEIFGDHNLQNMEGARLVCEMLGVNTTQFYEAMSVFKGAARRLEKIHGSQHLTVFRDFAHSPSKLKSTVNAVKQQFPDKKVVAVFELHTFSSLDSRFLPQYAHSMDLADTAMVYFDEVTLKQKNRLLQLDEVEQGFGGNVTVYNQPEILRQAVYQAIEPGNTILLLMSSGTFGGIRWEF